MDEDHLPSLGWNLRLQGKAIRPYTKGLVTHFPADQLISNLMVNKLTRRRKKKKGGGRASKKRVDPEKLFLQNLLDHIIYYLDSKRGSVILSTLMGYLLYVILFKKQNILVTRSSLKRGFGDK